jgi:hypothetical protein
MSAPRTNPERNPGQDHDLALPELDSTLALLAAANPRMGLEQRVLARLAAAPSPPAWYQRLASGHLPLGWMMTAAAAIIVAGTVTYGVEHWRAGDSSFGADQGIARPARPVNRLAVSPAASVGVPDHPLEQAAPPPQTSLRHRGIRRAYRAQHARTALPPGTAVPSHPHLLSAPQ